MLLIEVVLYLIVILEVVIKDGTRIRYKLALKDLFKSIDFSINSCKVRQDPKRLQFQEVEFFLGLVE